MADRDAILLPSARKFYDGCLTSEQHQLDYILEFLCEDPSPDGVVKLNLEDHPDAPRLYRDETFFVLYDEENSWTLAIWDMGYNTDNIFIIGRPDDD
jgi:hypothetical protein